MRDGNSALLALNTTPYSLVILDLGLPGKDGLQVLKEMRGRRDPTPVLVTTARDTVDDRIKGLDSGADDYLIKPYDLDELSARIRALLRRSAGRADPVIERGELKISPATREVTYKGEPVILSSKEYALLAALAERKGVVWSRAQLEEKLYNWDNTVRNSLIRRSKPYAELDTCSKLKSHLHHDEHPPEAFIHAFGRSACGGVFRRSSDLLFCSG